MRIRWIAGLCVYGKLPWTRRYLDLQLFAFCRQLSDGVTFLKFEIVWDRWDEEHYPQFGVEFTVLNCYNKFLIHT